MPSYKLNRNTNRIELYFSGIPEFETRNSLKRHGWRWEPRNTCWWHTDDEQARRFAKVLCDVQIEHTEVEGPKIENHGFFQSGSCGKLSEWILWPTGTLFVYGFGEIEDCNYHLLEQSSLYAVRDKVKTIKIHGGLSRIGKRAFYKFCEVRSVELADGITEIGDYAFAYCEQLETVKLPNKLVTIGTQAFRDCINLNEIEIPKSTENIAPDAFRGWKSHQRVFKNVDDFRGREVRIPLTTEMLYQP